jgi:hypothetical protein
MFVSKEYLNLNYHLCNTVHKVAILEYAVCPILTLQCASLLPANIVQVLGE